MNHTFVTREVVGSIHGVHQSSHHSHTDILRCKTKFYFWRAKILTAQFFNTRALLDSGSTGCLYNRRAIPYGSKTIKTKHSTVSTTTQGTYESNEIVMMEDVQMMEFTNSRHVRGVGASVFDSPTCPYDIILGRDFLRSIRLMIEFDFQTDTIVWLDERIYMKSINSVRNKLTMDVIGPQLDDQFFQQYIQETYFSVKEAEDDFMLDDEWDNYAREILGRKYGRVLPKDVASEQHHLNK